MTNLMEEKSAHLTLGHRGGGGLWLGGCAFALGHTPLYAHTPWTQRSTSGRSTTYVWFVMNVGLTTKCKNCVVYTYFYYKIKIV